MVVHTYNPSTQGGGGKKITSSRLTDYLQKKVKRVSFMLFILYRNNKISFCLYFYK